MIPSRNMVDLSDPRVAAELQRLSAGAERMDRDIAASEAAARQLAEDTAVLFDAPAERPAPPAFVVVMVLPVR